jgi:uncharacterized membrane protein YkoI
MKINRFFALAVIALLVVGAMGAVSLRGYAQTSSPASSQAQSSEDVSTGPDTDNVQEQVGEQVEDGQPDGPEADTGLDEQTPSYSSSILADQTATEGVSEEAEAAALQDQATVSAADAEAAALAANPGTTVIKTELDNENGALVYSVELSNGSDVKVDAGNGTVLYMDSGLDNEQ